LQQGLKVGQHIEAKLLLYRPGNRPLPPTSNFIAMRELMAQERIILHQAVLTILGLVEEFFPYASHSFQQNQHLFHQE
jgi:hypothetical protein